MVERFALLTELEALLGRAEVRSPSILSARSINCDPVDRPLVVGRPADDAHQLALRLGFAAGDAGSEWDVLWHG
jgi:hypothetical protein